MTLAGSTPNGLFPLLVSMGLMSGTLQKHLHLRQCAIVDATIRGHQRLVVMRLHHPGLLQLLRE